MKKNVIIFLVLVALVTPVSFGSIYSKQVIESYGSDDAAGAINQILSYSHTPITIPPIGGVKLELAVLPGNAYKAVPEMYGENTDYLFVTGGSSVSFGIKPAYYTSDGSRQDISGYEIAEQVTVGGLTPNSCISKSFTRTVYISSTGRTYYPSLSVAVCQDKEPPKVQIISDSVKSYSCRDSKIYFNFAVTDNFDFYKTTMTFPGVYSLQGYGWQPIAASFKDISGNVGASGESINVYRCFQQSLQTKPNTLNIGVKAESTNDYDWTDGLPSCPGGYIPMNTWCIPNPGYGPNGQWPPSGYVLPSEPVQAPPLGWPINIPLPVWLNLKSYPWLADGRLNYNLDVHIQAKNPDGSLLGEYMKTISVSCNGGAYPITLGGYNINLGAQPCQGQQEPPPPSSPTPSPTSNPSPRGS
jgi:hypothetical protein